MVIFIPAVTAEITVEISLECSECSQNREMGGGCSEYSQFTGAPSVVGADQRVALTLYTVVLKASGFHSGVMLVGATTITHVQILSQFYQRAPLC